MNNNGHNTLEIKGHNVKLIAWQDKWAHTGHYIANAKGQKYPGRCVVAEPKLSSYRKPKFIGQNE